MNLEQIRKTAEQQLSLSDDPRSFMINAQSPESGQAVHPISGSPSFHLQRRIALRNCGRINPEDVNHFIVRGNGYAGLSKALDRNPPDLIRTSIMQALKGRLGLGCSTLKKWEAAAEAVPEEKCLICNAVDPDPKSRISRLLLENDPHSVLEGLLIGAYASGASRCYLLVEEKTDAVPRLRKALDQMRTFTLLGSNILNTRFHSEIEILQVAETVLAGYQVEWLRCMDESRIPPHILPAHPVSGALSGKRALVVNPEAMASLAAVLGEEGIDADQGSKVITLTGSVAHPCTVEVPHGMTMQNIIDSFGGGISEGKSIKAVQLGGPSGYFIAPDALDYAVGCDASDESYSSIGSGTIEVLDSDACIVTATKDIMAHLQAQSCGKCVLCREGCLQLLTMLEDISAKKARPQDLDLLAELGEEMKQASLCDFGRTAPNAVLSSIELFRDEYEKWCQAPMSLI